MRPVEHPTTDLPVTTPGDASTATADGRTPGTRHFRSLILPGLVSADALVPAWLRRIFRRTNTPAAR